MSLAYHCEICSGANPKWRIERHGDAVVTWACDDHLTVVCAGLQRDFEGVTTLTVENHVKRDVVCPLCQVVHGPPMPPVMTMLRGGIDV